MAWGLPNANEHARGPANSCRRRYHAGGDRLEHPILRVGVLVLAQQGNVHTASFTAIGALSDAVLLHFDWQKKDYLKISIREQVEVAFPDWRRSPTIRRASPPLHIHVVLGTRDGSAKDPQVDA